MNIIRQFTMSKSLNKHLNKHGFASVNVINGLSNCEIEDILMNAINDNKIKKEASCPECGGMDFIEDYAKGIVLCNCGQVVDNIYDSGLEKRNYDGNDGEVARCGNVHNKLLPQSSLGTTVTAKGKLRKLHIWNSMPYKERSDNIMFKRIHEVCTTNGIVKKIEDDAKILCKRTSGTVHKLGKNMGKPIITRGFNRAGIVAACLFIACRRNDETRSTKEIAAYFKINERDVNKGIRSLLGILDDDNIVKDIGTSKVLHFIKRKCDELHIKTKFADVAITIAKNIERLNIASNHTTYSLAAASILLMADINGLKSITKKKLSKAFYDLSDVTIGKTFKQIKDLRTILVDNNKVNEILTDISLQKRKRIITKEVWNQMKKFNVDTSTYVLEGQEKNIHDNNNDIDQGNFDISDLSSDEFYDTIFDQKVNDFDYIVQDVKNTDLMNDEFYDDMIDQESDNSRDDFDYMIQDVKNIIHELKCSDTINNDQLHMLLNLETKFNIINLYIDQWAREIESFSSRNAKSGDRKLPSLAFQELPVPSLAFQELPVP
jgi:transcription initiation factor TFIIB